MKIQGGFLEKYMEYTLDSAAPEIYHLFSGLAVFAHTLGRNVFLEWGYSRLFPAQIFVMLTGPSGIKKSTAVDIATDLLREIPSIRFTSGKLSAQGLLSDMQVGYIMNGTKMEKAQSIIFIRARELANFLPKAAYVEEIIPLITDLADAPAGPFIYRTIKYTIEVYDPLMSALVASTPEWLYKAIPESAWDGGFMSRFLLIHQDKRSRVNYLPTRTKRIDRLKKELIAEMFWANLNLKGSMVLTRQAVDWWMQWNKDFDAKVDQLQSNSSFAGYLARRPIHTIKIACVLACSKRKLIVTSDDFEESDYFLTEMEVHLEKLLSRKTASAEGEKIHLVLDHLPEGIFSKRDLAAKIWRLGVTSPQLDVYLETFTEAGILKQIVSGQKHTIRYCKM